uniref:Ppr10 n=1 Tax=Arundo donax TaxID=35708 RepID=A0A0A9FKS0_ARUDO
MLAVKSSGSTPAARSSSSSVMIRGHERLIRPYTSSTTL